MAGALNILRGFGEYGDECWAARYKTVFDRMEAMVLPEGGVTNAAVRVWVWVARTPSRPPGASTTAL